MKISDLMIGDWVLHEGTHKKVTVVWDDAISLYNPQKTWGSIYYDKYYDAIEPVPLTPEILERNGFREYAKDAYAFSCHKQMAGDGFELQSVVIRNMKALEVSTADADLRTSMKYVHQLQHALRLCGIDKKIEL